MRLPWETRQRRPPPLKNELLTVTRRLSSAVDRLEAALENEPDPVPAMTVADDDQEPDRE